MPNRNPTADEMRHPDFCWSHAEVESGLDKNGEQYSRCLECGHLFVTMEDLVNDHNAQVDLFIKNFPNERITLKKWKRSLKEAFTIDACPHCTHSF